MSNHLRLLYHFTSRTALEAILRADAIAVTSGPEGRRWSGQHTASSLQVVWLTDDWDPGIGRDHGLAVPGPYDPRTDKRAVRITVAVSDAQHWPEWAHRRKVGRKTLREIDDSGGGLSERWWIVTRPVSSKEWVRIEDLRSGEVLWPRQTADATAGLTSAGI
jgi:hypothetical protein